MTQPMIKLVVMRVRQRNHPHRKAPRWLRTVRKSGRIAFLGASVAALITVFIVK
jgi:hypothetical protein